MAQVPASPNRRTARHRGGVVSIASGIGEEQALFSQTAVVMAVGKAIRTAINCLAEVMAAIGPR